MARKFTFLFLNVPRGGPTVKEVFLKFQFQKNEVTYLQNDRIFPTSFNCPARARTLPRVFGLI